MFIDSHCHLDYFSDEEIKNIIENCRKNRVGVIISNGTNRKTNLRNLEIADSYDEVKVALGVYPIEALKLRESDIKREIEFVRKNKEKIVAVGEVGMDFKESEERERQITNFEKFIELAKELNKPIIVHSRKAEKECIEVLEKLETKKVLMHCFSGKMNLVERIIKNGWKMSIPTNVKFSTQFQDIIGKVPIENLLCETDSPYLHPDKEFPNKSANVIESYKKIAEIKRLDLKKVEDIIEKNYLAFFGLG